jgi:hypothetical protein
MRLHRLNMFFETSAKDGHNVNKVRHIEYIFVLT